MVGTFFRLIDFHFIFFIEQVPFTDVLNIVGFIHVNSYYQPTNQPTNWNSNFFTSMVPPYVTTNRRGWFAFLTVFGFKNPAFFIAVNVCCFSSAVRSAFGSSFSIMASLKLALPDEILQLIISTWLDAVIAGAVVSTMLELLASSPLPAYLLPVLFELLLNC